MMSIRNALLCLLLVLGPVTLPAIAQVNVHIDIGVPPPPVRYEVVPPPRIGYIWAPGYWRWEGRRHVWTEGHWIEARPGSRWVADRWEARGERHHFQPGHWEREREHGEREHERKGKGYAKGHEREHEREERR